MLRIRKRALEKAIEHVEKEYPYEACGLLLGKVHEDVRTVFGVFPTPNVYPERKGDRYQIDPKDYLKAEQKAKQFGLDIVGVFHSHPDHPDRPSQFDEERAFEGFSYIIFSVSNSKVVSYRSWELVDGKFVEEAIEIFGF